MIRQRMGACLHCRSSFIGLIALVSLTLVAAPPRGQPMFVELRARMRAAIVGRAMNADWSAAMIMYMLRTHYQVCDVRWAVIAWFSEHRLGESANVGHMSGTTCNIPVPPTLCAVVGGAAIEFTRDADGVGVKAAAIFVPRALVPRNQIEHTLDQLLVYRLEVVRLTVQCLNGIPVDDETDYSVLARCIGGNLLEHYYASPAALFANKGDEIGWDFAYGGIIDIVLLDLDVGVYVLPHHLLGRQER